MWALLAAQAVVESGEDLKAVKTFHEAKVERLRGWMVHLLGSGLPAVERARAGICLAKLGDPRFDPEVWFLPKDPRLGFCDVPEGSFLMGSDRSVDPRTYDEETPQHELHLPAFYLARFPVTVAQFQSFVEDSGYTDHHPASLEGVSNHPVVVVSWFDAWNYCAWLEKKLRLRAETILSSSAEPEPLWQKLAEGILHVGLPSEAEWEKAARGGDGRIFPWGNPSDVEKANYNETGVGEPNTVGCFSAGRSPFGCEEMAGNVWEWTRSGWGKDFWNPEFAYPYDPQDGREDKSREILRVLRGGSCFNYDRDVRSAFRSRGNPDGQFSNIGFRVGLFPFSLDS
jgi:formylglycine-generating enzyme required for sulfatase activity